MEDERHMILRKLKLKDYGITAEQNKWAVEQARLKENEKLVRLAAKQSHPGIADDIAKALIEGVSYDKLNKKDGVNIKRDDFYAYRRKAIYIFWTLLTGKGKQGQK